MIVRRKFIFSFFVVLCYFYLDLALNLDLDLDRDLDSPTATAISATGVVPGTAAPAAPSCTPPEAPNLKKNPMSYLPAWPQNHSTEPWLKITET